MVGSRPRILGYLGKKASDAQLQNENKEDDQEKENDDDDDVGSLGITTRRRIPSPPWFLR